MCLILQKLPQVQSQILQAEVIMRRKEPSAPRRLFSTHPNPLAIKAAAKVQLQLHAGLLDHVPTTTGQARIKEDLNRPIALARTTSAMPTRQKPQAHCDSDAATGFAPSRESAPRRPRYAQRGSQRGSLASRLSDAPSPNDSEPSQDAHSIPVSQCSK